MRLPPPSVFRALFSAACTSLAHLFPAASPEDCEDAVADALEQLCKAPPEEISDLTVGLLVFRGKARLIDRFRKYGVRRPGSARPLGSDDPRTAEGCPVSTLSEDLASDPESTLLLLDFVSTPAPRMQACVALWIEGYSDEAVCERLGMTPTSVRQMRSRAKRKLERYCGRPQRVPPPHRGNGVRGMVMSQNGPEQRHVLYASRVVRVSSAAFITTGHGGESDFSPAQVLVVQPPASMHAQC